MHIDRRFLNWGIFFVVLGLIPLAVQLGWVDARVLSGWWRLWPLILIGIGIGLLLRRTPFHFAGGLIVAATFAMMLGSLAASGDGGFTMACSSSDPLGTAFTGRSGAITGNGSVSLELSCGDLTVRTAPGSGWTVSGTAPDGQGPRIDAAAERLTVRSSNHDWFGPFGLGAGGETWTVTLPADPTLAVSATVNAGTARLDLTNSHLASVSMTANAGSVRVDLSGASIFRLDYTLNAGSTRIVLPAASMSGGFTVNAGSLGLCAPPGVGVRINLNDNFAAGNNLAARGLVQSGSTWSTPGFNAAAVKINLSATTNVGRIELDPEGGCQ